jgi:hypothetical protein
MRGDRPFFDFAAYAQEFLRRNADYVAHYAALRRCIMRGAAPEDEEVMARRWGLCFPVPPEASPELEPALWQPWLHPASIILEPAPDAFDGLPADSILGSPDVLVDRETADGHHVVLGDVDGPHHIWLKAPVGSASLAFVLPHDAFFQARCRAGTRLDRRLAGKPTGRDAPTWSPTRFQRQRLDLLLAILDARLSGLAPTSYDIAMRVIFPGLRIARGIEWKSSPERRRTLRLIDQAQRLMAGGYRDLLRGLVRG